MMSVWFTKQQAALMPSGTKAEYLGQAGVAVLRPLVKSCTDRQSGRLRRQYGEALLRESTAVFHL
jgi:hypothetical protein